MMRNANQLMYIVYRLKFVQMRFGFDVYTNTLYIIYDDSNNNFNDNNK